MTTTPAAIIETKFAALGQATEYTSESMQTSIDKFSANNNSALAARLTVYVVPEGGGPDASNSVSKVILPGKSWGFPDLVGHVLEDGDFLVIESDAADAISIRCSGRKFT